MRSSNDFDAWESIWHRGCPGRVRPDVTTTHDVAGIAGWNIEYHSRRHRRLVGRFVERVIKRRAQASRAAVMGVSHNGAWKWRWITIYQRHSRPIELAQRALIHLPHNVKKLAVGRLRFDRIKILWISRKRVSRVMHDRIEIVRTFRHRSPR